MKNLASHMVRAFSARRPRRRRLRLALAAVALVGVGSGHATAGDGGALDPSFGTGGRVTTDFRPSPEFTFSSGGAAAIAIQGDGKIVATGFAQPFRGATAAEFALARYNIDGSLDTRFGDSGEVTTQFGGGFDAVTRVFAVAIQRDGKIIAAGEAGSSESATGTDFALARYNTDGSLDATFGDGGKVTSDFGSGDGATAVAIQGDEKIIAVGFGGGGVALARYETDGSLDASFGDGGKVKNLSLRMGVTAAAMQQNGQIVVGGFAVNRPDLDFALARFNNDGSLDTSFGSDGEVTTDFGGSGDVSQAIALQASGPIVAVGYTDDGSNTDFALARYKADGRLDKSFGTGGTVTTDFSGTRDSAAAVAIQRNGRIVAAGQTSSGGGDFALARYKNNGRLDPRFGSGGKVSTDFGADDAAQALAIQRDGRLVAAGVTVGGGGSSFALARYLAG